MRIAACLLFFAACGPTSNSFVPEADLAGSDFASQLDLLGSDAGATFTVGGSVTGLTGTLILRNNGADDLTRTTDGAFTFSRRLANGAHYAVTVQSQPAGQRCTISSGSGDIMSANVTGVTVTCVEALEIGGTVSGLLGGTLVLQNNGGDDLIVNSPSTGFTFNTALLEGEDYLVTVLGQPTGQVCTVSAASGTVGASPVTDIAVSCRKLAVLLDEIYPHVGNGVYGDTNGDGLRDSGDDEFIEVVNRESFAVDISDWVIRVNSPIKYTFPAGTMLSPGRRAVIFGGGTPTGGFGGALVLVGTGFSLTDGGAQVSLESRAVGAVAVDTFFYAAPPCPSSKCESWTRVDAGFVTHGSVSGLWWSPGTAPTQAVPKLSPAFSSPAGGAINVSVIGNLIAQFNLIMNAAGFTTANFKLYASPCAAPANERPLSSVVQGADTSQVLLTPATPLSFTAVYCVTVDASLESSPSPSPTPSPVSLGALASWQFTTRNAESSPAGSVVISEVGGCRMSSTNGQNMCTNSGIINANDEFVELHNATAAPVNISGWFIQRRTAGGSTNCWAALPTPAPAIIAPGGFYLIGGAGYDYTHYLTAFPSPSPDYLGGGTSLSGTSESVVLIDKDGTCTGSTHVIDSVSYGGVTETASFLRLPPFRFSPSPSLERKACWDSTEDNNATTGLFSPGGGQTDSGNGERLGASDADWIRRPTPEPQSSHTGSTETTACGS